MDQSIQSYLKPELDEASKVLLKAADLIEEFGHCQSGSFHGRDGSSCVLGALSSVTLFSDLYEQAVHRLQGALGRRYISDWSDNTPTAEVLAKLRSVSLGG